MGTIDAITVLHSVVLIIVIAEHHQFSPQIVHMSIVDMFAGCHEPRDHRHQAVLSSIEVQPNYGTAAGPSHLTPQRAAMRARRPTMPDPQPVDVIASIVSLPGRQHRSMSHDHSILYPHRHGHGHDRHDHWWNRHSSAGLENDFLFFERRYILLLKEYKEPLLPVVSLKEHFLACGRIYTFWLHV